VGLNPFETPTKGTTWDDDGTRWDLLNFIFGEGYTEWDIGPDPGEAWDKGETEWDFGSTFWN
jgi:hypothetical protein